MKIIDGQLAGMLRIKAEPFIDERGLLARTFEQALFTEKNISTEWLQESFSRTTSAGTLRGLHVQTPPFVEAKLITILCGRMRWVTLDLRENSATFGQHVVVDLDGEKLEGLYVPRGFGHGCLSLTDECDLIIKSDNRYDPAHGAGIIWNDPELAVDWGLEGREPLISAGHRAFGSFAAFRETVGAIAST